MISGFFSQRSPNFASIFFDISEKNGFVAVFQRGCRYPTAPYFYASKKGRGFPLPCGYTAPQACALYFCLSDETLFCSACSVEYQPFWVIFW